MCVSVCTCGGNSHNYSAWRQYRSCLVYFYTTLLYRFLAIILPASAVCMTKHSHKSMMWLRQIAQLSTTISANKQESVMDGAMVFRRATHPKTTVPRHSTVETGKRIMRDREGGMGHINDDTALFVNRVCSPFSLQTSSCL